MTDKCWVCFGGAVECVCDRSRAANDNAPFDPNFIRLPHGDVLGKPAAVRRLAIAYRAFDLSRRSILDFVTDQLNSYKGIVIAGLERVKTDNIDVDLIFRTDEDPSERWLSSFLNFAVEPPRQQAQERVEDRLTVLWLALAIARRGQAELVTR